MREKLTKFIEKDGFYLILFICVCVVAIAAVMTSKKNLDNANNISEKEDDLIILENESETEGTVESANIERNDIDEEETEEELEEPEEIEESEEKLTEEELEEEPIEEEIQDETETEESEEDLGEPDEAQETIAISDSPSEPANNMSDMVAPVLGKVEKDYTENNLVYSETLEEWTAHKGVDIAADEGAQVLAALSGIVQETYDDPLWGKVVILSHGEGMLTKYANLSEEVLVEEGASVNKGNPIGRVGTTASIEMMEKAHVHFEVIKDGISVNPKNYLPSIVY